MIVGKIEEIIKNNDSQMIVMFKRFYLRHVHERDDHLMLPCNVIEVWHLF